MKTALWKILAFIVSRRPIARRLISRAQRTPYFHLTGYMERYWLFNRYDGRSSAEAEASSDRQRHSARRWPWLPSVRIHRILRADNADHPHDHPWDARTIILDGGYVERRHHASPRIMRRCDTAPIRHGDYHHIEHVTPGGVWTLFITWDYQGSWGFLVNGKKVPWRVYEAEHQRHGAHTEAQPVTKCRDERSPSYDALLIIAHSVCGALERAGIEDCDDPGEAIDVMRERMEQRIAELSKPPSAPVGVGELVAKWRANAARKRDHNTATGAAEANGYDIAANELEALAQQPAAVDERIRSVAWHIGKAVDYIEKQWPDAKQLDRGPILRNMRRWHAQLTVALAAQQGDES